MQESIVKKNASAKYEELKDNDVNLSEFYDYVYSFYNVTDGVYPEVNARRSEIELATYILYNTNPDFCGDSLDRERVRFIIESMREIKG